MTLLRIARSSNDIANTIGLVVSLALTVVCAFFAVALWPPADIFGFVVCAIGAFFAISCYVLASRLITPYEFELVIEKDLIRFGRTDQVDNQRSISRSGIICVVFDDDDVSLGIDVGNLITPPLAQEVITEKSRLDSIILAIKEHWPEVKVLNQDSYQEFCKQRMWYTVSTTETGTESGGLTTNRTDLTKAKMRRRETLRQITQVC